MLEYEIYELKEEQERLPPISSNNTTTINNKSPKTRYNPYILLKSDTSQKHKASTISATTTESVESSLPAPTCSVIYPEVQEYVDQVAQPQQTTQKDIEAVPKRKRTRRVYVAELSRCASLRSRQPVAVNLPLTPEKASSPSPTAQSSPTPTEAAECHKYIKLGKQLELLHLRDNC